MKSNLRGNPAAKLAAVTLTLLLIAGCSVPTISADSTASSPVVTPTETTSELATTEPEPTTPSPSESGSDLLDQLKQNNSQPRIKAHTELPLGAVPPESQVTGSNTAYTVESYLTWIIADLDKKWTPWFTQNGYAEPQILYTIVQPGQQFVSVCTDKAKNNLVIVDNTPNAYYCPYDNNNGGHIWLPATTFQKMWTGDIFTRPSARTGDFGAAIITAHEFGHHVKDELTKQATAMGYSISAVNGANNELLADCFAGVWAATAYYDNLLEAGDFEEAVAALSAIGDAQPGGEDPHGSPAERVAALQLGYTDTADPFQCINAYWK